MNKFSTRKELHSIPAPTTRASVEVWHATHTGFGARLMRASKRTGDERRVYLARFLNADGIDKKPVLGTFEELSYDDALRLALDMRFAAKHERDTGSKALPTLGRALTEYLEDREDSLRPTTVEDYKRRWGYLKQHFDDNVLTLNGGFWLEKYGELRKFGKPTADGVLRVAHAVFQSLVDDERLAANPVKRVASKKEIFAASPPRQALVARADLPKVWRWLASRANPATRDLVLLTLMTGLRDSVLGSLEWAQIDLDARTVLVPEETRGNKAGVSVRVPLADWLVDEILRPRWAARLEDNPWVIPSTKKAGQPLRDYRGTARTMLKETGVYIHPHMLRKTMATIALQAVGSDLLVSRMLTHSTKSKGKSDSAAATAGYFVAEDDVLRDAFNMTAARILEYVTATPKNSVLVAENGEG